MSDRNVILSLFAIGLFASGVLLGLWFGGHDIERRAEAVRLDCVDLCAPLGGGIASPLGEPLECVCSEHTVKADRR